MNTDFGFKKTVLITGGSRGIGRFLSRKFAQNGYNVSFTYLKNKEEAEKTVKLVKELNAGVLALKCDISLESEIKEAVLKTIESFGQIDVLINNAGIIIPGPVSKMDDTSWDKVLDTNLKGPFLLIKECAGHMIKRKAGSIINISSIVGITGNKYASNYSASKAGLISLTKTASIELGKRSICVNAVLPGFHETDMGLSSGGKYIDKVKTESVLNRTTDINELAEFIFSLSTFKSVSGQVFNMDSRII